MFFPFPLDPETTENKIIYFDPKKLVGLFAMATPFRRRGYHGAYLAGIGELRRFTISGNRQDAGKATAAIPRSIGDDSEEFHHGPLSQDTSQIGLTSPAENFTRKLLK